MKFKILPERKLKIVISIGFAFFLIISGLFLRGLNLYTNNQAKDNSALLVGNNQEVVRGNLPVRLKIPKINVDANIEYVGLTDDGSMDKPKGPNDLVWFNLGPRPGENGSAVIAGHYGWKNNIPAIFDDLYKLEKGDLLYIEDEKGNTITFVVREGKSYNTKEDPSDVFGSNDMGSHLNLVTCEGIWDKASASYSKRLVIFTDKE